MIKRAIRIFIAIALVAIVALLYFGFHTEKENISVGKAEIRSIETMSELCTVEVYSEVPVLDTINDKVIFAIQKQNGNITFDLQDLKLDIAGDTVRAVLPPEKVNLYESTDKNSWEVIDTKAIGPLALIRSDKMTLEEENAVKSRVHKKSRRYLYSNGTVRRARAEARENRRSLLELTYRRPAEVTDPTPSGTPG